MIQKTQHAEEKKKTEKALQIHNTHPQDLVLSGGPIALECNGVLWS